MKKNNLYKIIYRQKQKIKSLEKEIKLLKELYDNSQNRNFEMLNFIHKQRNEIEEFKVNALKKFSKNKE